MTDIKLIHKSRAYADRILHPNVSEETIRAIVFECWTTAFNAGYESAIKQAPHREDMGR